MRISYLCFLALIALVAGRAPSWGSPEGNIRRTIKQHKYPVHEYEVTTEDGYVLRLFRIPHGRSQSDRDEDNSSEENQSSDDSAENSNTRRNSKRGKYSDELSSQEGKDERRNRRRQNDYDNDSNEMDSREERHDRQARRQTSSQDMNARNGERPAVLLMHGMLSDAEDFVTGGPKRGLAFALADAGYDVYLGNVRGSAYGQKHTKLNANKDAAFWDFCFDDFAAKDLPAIVDKVRSVSGQQKIFHIGHNEGTTSFYAYIAQNPEDSKKIEAHVSLGPMVFMENAKSVLLNDIAKQVSSKSWVTKNLGMHTFSPSAELMQNAREDCENEQDNHEMCNNAYFLLNGYNSRNMNKKTLQKLLGRLPSTGSVKDISHLALMKKTGKFQHHDEDESSGEKYDLSNVKMPVAIFYTPNDPLASVEDVKELKNKLPEADSKLFTQFDNNLDLIHADDADDDVYPRIISFLKAKAN